MEEMGGLAGPPDSKAHTQTHINTVSGIPRSAPELLQGRLTCCCSAWAISKWVSRHASQDPFHGPYRLRGCSEMTCQRSLKG